MLSIADLVNISYQMWWSNGYILNEYILGFYQITISWSECGRLC